MQAAGHERGETRWAFSAMAPGAARTIADEWKYPPPYDFHDGTADAEDHEEFITPELWPEHFWQVHREDELVGFLTAEAAGDGTATVIGLGMRPDLTGRGLGAAFVSACLDVIARTTMPRAVTLSVVAFNQRAIACYRSVGFVVTGHHVQATNGGHFDFVDMELHRG